MIGFAQLLAIGITTMVAGMAAASEIAVDNAKGAWPDTGRCSDAPTNFYCNTVQEFGAQCIWVQGTGCVSSWTVCANASASQEQCQSSPLCAFNPLLSVCTVACAFINATSGYCPMNSYCMVYNTTHCVPRCFATFSDQMTCNLDMMCAWNPATGQCQDTCSKSGTAATCAQSGLCLWNVTGGVSASFCQPSCSIAVNASACSSFAPQECEWDASVNECQAMQ